MHNLSHLFSRLLWSLLLGGSVLLLTHQHAIASVYSGPGVVGGLNEASGLGGISDARSITEILLILIAWALDIILLVAVAAVIIAGIYLIVSNGDDGAKDKAKKIIFYVIAGIVLILFARFIVVAVNNIF